MTLDKFMDIFVGDSHNVRLLENIYVNGKFEGAITPIHHSDDGSATLTFSSLFDSKSNDNETIHRIINEEVDRVRLLSNSKEISLEISVRRDLMPSQKEENH